MTSCSIYLSLSDLFHLAQCLQGLFMILQMTGYPHFLWLYNTPLYTYGNCFIGQSVQFSCSVVWLFATPWTTAHQASLSISISRSTQTHVHWVSDAIQPPHPLLSASPPAFNLSQHQGLFQWHTLRLLPYLGYCKWCISKHGAADIFSS